VQHERESKRRIGQWLAVLVTGMLAGSIIITPVGAHISSFNHLKTKHPYTKTAADARFVDTGEASGLTVAHAATAGRATNIYSAQVDSSGTLLGSVPPGATSSRLGLGDYTVIFQRSAACCIISSSLGTKDLTFALGETNVAPYALNPNGLRVATANSAGTLADRDFAVQMICP
jgi:hypothetical protein